MNLANFLNDLETNLPEFIPVSKLVEIGVFSSPAQESKARKRGEGPDFIRLSRKRLVYPRGPLMTWLRERAGRQSGV